MMEGAHCFGPTAAAAATLTQVGSDFYIEPGSGGWHIYMIRVGFANVVNAKESAGYAKIIVAKQTGDYEYVVGHGTGGATNCNGLSSEVIPVAINAENNAKIQAKIYNAEAIKDAVISIHYRQGQGRKAVCYRCGGAGSDVTAGTELTVGTMKIDQGPGDIRQIRFTGSGVVDALAETAKLTLEIPGSALTPYTFAVGNGAAGAATAGQSKADMIELKHGIEVKDGVTITAKVLNLVTTGSALLSCGVSIQVV